PPPQQARPPVRPGRHPDPARNRLPAGGRWGLPGPPPRRAPPPPRRGPGRPWRRLSTVRVRTTAAAVMVAGLAMAVGALALVAVLRDTLTREVEATARLRAADLVSLLASDPAGRRSLAVDDPEEWIIQVLDEGGQVVRSSPNAEGVGPVARLRPGESSEIAVEAGG